MANDTPDPQHTAMICRQIEFLFLIKDWLQMTVYQSYEVQVSAALSAVIEREADDPTEAISGIVLRDFTDNGEVEELTVKYYNSLGFDQNFMIGIMPRFKLITALFCWEFEQGYLEKAAGSA